MNTQCLKLHRPWWQRAAEALREAWIDWHAARAQRIELDAARELDEQTLRDIGAPLWLVEQARQRREQLNFDRRLDQLRQDSFAGRGW